MNRSDILACWRSGQIEPAEMVRLCKEDPELDNLRQKVLMYYGNSS